MSDTRETPSQTVINRLFGNEQIPEAEAPVKIVAAYNDFTARGHGTASARRVYRNGVWVWFGERASFARLRSADRHDRTYGDVWIGELIVDYTLGRQHPKPYAFYVVTELPGDDRLFELPHCYRRDGKYSVSVPGQTDPLVVPDPTWR